MTGEAPNQVTPRHFAALLILRQVADVRRRLAELQESTPDPADYFLSQLRVWLERTVEELQAAAAALEIPPPEG